MQVPDTALANGRPTSLPSRRRERARSELDELRATCRCQALTIEALGAAVSSLRRGAAALKAENADMRAQYERRRAGRRGSARATGRRDADADAAVAVRLPCDVRAPGAARIVVAECLRERGAAGVLDSAQLLISELVTNSVLHSGACAVLVRVSLSRTMVRLEVEDSGRGGVVAPRSPDVDGGGGFGLQLVQALSERWGLERVAQGGTSVWVELPRTAASAPAPADEPGSRDSARPSLTQISQPAGGDQTPAEGES